MTTQNKLLFSDRRNFLKTLASAAVSSIILPTRFLNASSNANSRVVIVEDIAATSGNTINSTVVNVMVKSGIKSLAQNNDIGEAWKILLPGVTSSSIIAIKVNCLLTLCTHPIVTLAVANSLTNMIFNGTSFPSNNIIIYDRLDSELRKSEAGYTINKSTTGIRCMGTPSYSGSYNVSGVTQQLSSIITNQADFIINIAVLKQHSMSGVSLCMKNHYGSCNNPGGLHNSDCNPYIAALNALSPIKTKQKVNMIDGLFGIRSGGPGGSPQFKANKIFMSTDVVAIDYCGRELLKANGSTSTGNSYHIETAANTYALGTNNPSNMDIVNITNPSTGIDMEDSENIPFETGLEQNYPNPFNPTTSIQYTLSKSGHATLKIFDVTGKEIITLADGYHAEGVHNALFNGHNLSSGIYICRLQTVDAVHSRKMVLIK